MDVAIDAAQFVRLMNERLPAAAERVRPYCRHQYDWVRSFRRATWEALRSGNRSDAEAHFAFINEVLQNASAELESSIIEEYFERLWSERRAADFVDLNNFIPPRILDILCERENRKNDRIRLAALPNSMLLHELEVAVTETIGAAARDAVAQLSSERIYGFFLMHYIFEVCWVAVLTEDQYDKSIRKYLEFYPDRPSSRIDRWSPVDCGHYFFREDLFDQAHEVFDALRSRWREEGDEGDKQRDEVARIFVRTMRHVRQTIMTDPRIVLSVMDYTEGPNLPFYAYAELFNDTSTLAKLREELPFGPDWDYLDLLRSQLPSA